MIGSSTPLFPSLAQLQGKKLQFGDSSNSQQTSKDPGHLQAVLRQEDQQSSSLAKENAHSDESDTPEAIQPRAESPADRIPLPTKKIQKEILSDDDRKNQKRYPGKYAHLALPLPFNQEGTTVMGTAKALGLWLRGTPAQDYQLSSLSNTTTMAGSAAIAILATLGMRGNPKKAKGAIEFVPEFLGVASWFGAMALTPKIIDYIVNIKTGVNLQQVYDSSYGERKKLYTDPHYVPMYLLSDKTINRIGKRLGIPENAPDRHDQIEDRIRQISVQAHTWWMLVAGPAAAVLSGLTCDILQTPVLNLANSLRKRLAQSSQTTLDCHIAERPEADLSQWWKKLGSTIIKLGGLNSRSPHYEIRANEIIKQLAQLSTPNTENQKRLKKIVKFLDKQRTDLNKIEKSIQNTLKNVPQHEKNTMERQAEERLANARSTIDHYQAVFKMIEKVKAPSAVLESRLRQRMESNLPVLQGLINHNWTTAQEFAGGEKNLQYIIKALQEKRPGVAANAMGAAPMEHIMQSLQDNIMRNRWQQRMSKGVGGGLMAATLVYVLFFVGKDFKNSEIDDREADPSLEEEDQ
jgi:hypothetical protein